MPLWAVWNRPAFDCRASVNAALEAEQLGLEQALRDGGAVDVDERTAAPRACLVDDAGEESLAGAGLSLEEHGRLARDPGLPAQEVAYILPEHGHGGAVSDEIGEGRHGEGILFHMAGESMRSAPARRPIARGSALLRSEQ